MGKGGMVRGREGGGGRRNGAPSRQLSQKENLCLVRISVPDIKKFQLFPLQIGQLSSQGK